VAHWACGAGASPQFCAAGPARHTAGATLARTLGSTSVASGQSQVPPLMNISKPLLLSLAALASCTQEAATKQAAEPDAVLLKARALQALVCVQVERSPTAWKSDFQLSGPGSNELWQTLSEQPLADHGRRLSSVYRRGTDQLYLVVQGGFPETMEVYGPLPAAPQCQGPR
jgi:hypothetical protein